MERNRAAVILAGGQSRRMGRDKAMILLDGIPFLQRIVNELSPMFETLLISSDRTEEYRFLNIPVVPDLLPDSGPLGGIHSAFHAVDHPSLFIVSCDMPLITRQLVKIILSSCGSSDICYPELGGQAYPLCGVYRREVLPLIETQLASGERAVHSLLQRPELVVLPLQIPEDVLQGNILANVNSPADLDRSLFRKRWS